MVARPLKIIGRVPLCFRRDHFCFLLWAWDFGDGFWDAAGFHGRILAFMTWMMGFLRVLVIVIVIVVWMVGLFMSFCCCDMMVGLSDELLYYDFF